MDFGDRRRNSHAPRKHGPFDTRWSCVRKDSSDRSQAGPLRAAESAEALEWAALSAHPFKLRLVENDSLLPPIETADDAGARRLLAAVAELQSCEGEGGFVPRSTEVRRAT